MDGTDPAAWLDARLADAADYGTATPDAVTTWNARLTAAARWIVDLARRDGPAEACEAIARAEIFATHSQHLATYMVARLTKKAAPIESDRERCVTYNVLLLRNEFGDILSAELIDVLVEDLWERTGSEAYLPAVQLFSEFCRKTQLDSRVLDKLDGIFVSFLFDQVEATRDYIDTSLNFALVVLIVRDHSTVAISFQFSLLKLGTQTPLERAAVRPDPVLATVRTAKFRLRTFSESFCTIFNRGTVGDIADGSDEEVQMLLLEFLSGLTGDPSTADLFYPADLNVLLDTILREVGNLPLGELHTTWYLSALMITQLRQLYLECLLNILTHSPYWTRPHKPAEVLALLRALQGDERVDRSTRQLAALTLDTFGPRLAALA